MKFPIKDFFRKCDQIRSFLWIWSNLMKKSLMKNFFFCTVSKQLYQKNKQKNVGTVLILQNTDQKQIMHAIPDSVRNFIYEFPCR